MPTRIVPGWRLICPLVVFFRAGGHLSIHHSTIQYVRIVQRLNDLRLWLAMAAVRRREGLEAFVSGHAAASPSTLGRRAGASSFSSALVALVSSRLRAFLGEGVPRRAGHHKILVLVRGVVDPCCLRPELPPAEQFEQPTVSIECISPATGPPLLRGTA